MRLDQTFGVDLDCGIADRGYKGDYKERDVIEHDATGKWSIQKFTRVYIGCNCILKNGAGSAASNVTSWIGGGHATLPDGVT